MAMAMRMLMTMEMAMAMVVAVHATACFHQCLLAEYYYDGACCFTANCQRPLNFVFCSESLRQRDSLGMVKGEKKEVGTGVNLPGQPARKLSWLSPELLLLPLLLLEYFCILCVVSRAIFFLFFSSLPAPCPVPMLFGFLFILSFCFHCISYAFRLLSLLPYRWPHNEGRKLHSADTLLSTPEETDNVSLTSQPAHSVAFPWNRTASNVSSLSLTPTRIIQISHIRIRYIRLSVCAGIYIKSTVQSKALAEAANTMGTKIEWRLKWKLTFE